MRVFGIFSLEKPFKGISVPPNDHGSDSLGSSMAERLLVFKVLDGRMYFKSVANFV